MSPKDMPLSKALFPEGTQESLIGNKGYNTGLCNSKQLLLHLLKMLCSYSVSLRSFPETMKTNESGAHQPAR